MKAEFQIKKSAHGRFRFTLKAANDQIILTSQTYGSKDGVANGIASVKQNAALDERFEEKTGASGLPYFVLHAANRLVIGTSQTYSSREAMHKGIASVKRNAPTAETADLTADVRSATGTGAHG